MVRMLGRKDVEKQNGKENRNANEWRKIELCFALFQRSEGRRGAEKSQWEINEFF